MFNSEIKATHLAGWIDAALSEDSEHLVSEYMINACRLGSKGLRHQFQNGMFIAHRNQVLKIGSLIVAYTGFPVIDRVRKNHGEGNILQALASLYREFGESLTKHISGSFTIAIHDSTKGKTLFAIDAIGINTLFYAEVSSGLVIGTSASAVIVHPDVNSEIELQSIYDYVYFHHCPSPSSIYSGVKKLQGGEQLVYKDKTLTVTRYWDPVFNEQNSGFHIDDAAEELRETLSDSVRGCVVGADTTGAFLSGGLDSSSVAEVLSRVYPRSAKTFSIGFPVKEYDEIGFARVATESFDTQSNEYYLTPEDTVESIQRIAAFYDEPFGNSSALPALYCASLAKEKGIKRMLAGDGGDEIFAGNERYVQQLLFDQYSRVPKIIRSVLENILSTIPVQVKKIKLLHKADRYVTIANTQMPDRLQDYNFLHRHAADSIFNKDFIASIDVLEPPRLLRDRYNEPDGASMLNRMLYMDWKSTLHDNDLVKVNRMCEMAGIEVVYPMLDLRMVDFSCRIPSSIKIKNRKLRWFFKYAMRDILPEQILNKSKHGFGLPFGVWLKEYQPLKEIAYDSIECLKKRGYFNKHFLDHAKSMHESVHASYYGELIWILMMLELWMSNNRKPSSH